MLNIIIISFIQPFLIKFYLTMKNKVLNTEESFNEELSSSIANLEKRMQLEGEVKIEAIRFLKIQWPKAIILTFLLTLTFFGLIVLKLFKKFRVVVFYSEVEAEEATYVYIESSDGIQDIEGITR